MKPRYIKILGGFIILIVLLFVFKSIHDPIRALSYNAKSLDREIQSFLEKVEAIEFSREYKAEAQSAHAGYIMSSQSEDLWKLLERKQISLQIYVDEEIRFWSTNVNETSGSIYANNGLNLIHFKTGWFLVKRINHGRLTGLYTSPLQYQYRVPNQFLKNDFAGDFSMPKGFQIQKERSAYSSLIYNPENHKVLGYLGLDPKLYEQNLDIGQILTLLGILLSVLFLIYNLNKLVKEGYPDGLRWVLGIPLPILCLYLISQYLIFLNPGSIAFFSPQVYHDYPFFHCLAEYTLLLVAGFWFLYYAKLWPSIPRTNFSRIVSLVLIGLISLIFTWLFRSLIYKTTIPLDLTNIFNLNGLTFLILGLLALTWLLYYFSIRQLMAYWEEGMGSGIGFWILILILSLSFFSFYSFKSWEMILLILGFLIFLYFKGYTQTLFNLGFSLLIISLITSLEINRVTNLSEIKARKELAEQLTNSRDPELENQLSQIGSEISGDQVFLNHLEQTRHYSEKELNQEVQHRYFEKKFPNYEIQSYLYGPNSILSLGPDNLTLDIFSTVAKNPNFRKISNVFFQAPGKLGINNFFGIFPLVEKSGNLKGTLVIRLNARFIRENNSFPVLLLDQKNIDDQKGSIYSYALYKGNSLLDKYGKYPYSIGPYEFKPEIRETKDRFVETNGYNHLIHQPRPGEWIVVSIPVVNIYTQGTLFSYVFGYFSLIQALVLAFMLGFGQLGKIRTIKNLLEIFDSFRFLYKTRIQIAIGASVFISLVVIGWITLSYVNNQYMLQQKDVLSDQIDDLREVFEREMPMDSLNRQNERSNRLFQDFAAGHSQDLNLYNTEGDLVFTSLGKVFEEGLLSQKMDPVSYYQMFVTGRTEYIHQEAIGKLSFLSGYTPVRSGTNNQVIGYLNIPYFANQIELGVRLSSFSNALINVYIITFLLIGIFAILLANSLTYPLSLVQHSISQTKIGKLNQPIPWKRDDEIGDLISEYNKMMVAIEDSTQKLARSERESAWREMAKQVAHEIKNPLTPLKLGIQQLEKSWKEKDPNFEDKFKRYTRTFIEQIDSLSAISTEFSNFAKMPSPKEEKLNLLEVLDTLIHLFKASENIQLNLIANSKGSYWILADRDQISRAFTNLIKNAIQAIPENKKGHIEIRMKELESMIQIEIEDNGQGIDEELFPKIFQPNFTTKSSGMGLGLAFVSNVIKNAGGTIDFRSEKEKGTVFRIQIPRNTIE